MKIKKGDTVTITTGKDRGKSGTVLRTFPEQEQVLVEGVNVATKHQRSRRRGSQGQIIEKSMPVHVSNVAVTLDGKPVRVGYEFEGEGKKRKKVRVARPSGKKI